MFPVEYEQHFHGSRFTQWLIILAPTFSTRIVVEPSSRTQELQLVKRSRWILWNLYLIRRAKYLLFIGCSGRSPPKQFKIILCRLSCMPVFVIYVECERWLVKIPAWRLSVDYISTNYGSGFFSKAFVMFLLLILRCHSKF